MDKTYEGTIRLGRATATYDREGETVGAGPRRVGRRRRAGRRGRRGRSAASSCSRRRPTPPRRSAGRKFYEMARKGEAVPSLPKKVRVSELDLRRARRRPRSPFSISCSSGTYIRSIAQRARREARLRRAPGDACAAPGSASFRVERRGRARALRGAAAGRAPGRRPTPCPSSRVPVPLRAGPARLARGLEDPQGPGRSRPAASTPATATGSPCSGPADEMLALGQVTPIGPRRDRA